RIADLEQIIKEIQARHQADKETLLGAIMLTKRTSTSAAPAMTQASPRSNDKVPKAKMAAEESDG
nr:hypothetical protein [Tanacetum cinerariifolium]